MRTLSYQRQDEAIIDINWHSIDGEGCRADRWMWNFAAFKNTGLHKVGKCVEGCKRVFTGKALF
jgi:hypothetical protein